MRERSIHDLLDGLAEAERLRRVADGLAELYRSELRPTREEAGLTQSDVAEAMGVTKAYVSQLENGHGATTNSLRRYAQAIEGGTHGEVRRSAKEDLKKARRKTKDD